MWVILLSCRNKLLLLMENLHDNLSERENEKKENFDKGTAEEEEEEEEEEETGMKLPPQYITHKCLEGLVCLNCGLDIDIRTGCVLERFFINHSSCLLCGSNIVYIHSLHTGLGSGDESERAGNRSNWG